MVINYYYTNLSVRNNAILPLLLLFFYVNISVLKLWVKRQRQTDSSVDRRWTRSIITSTQIENQFLDFVNPITINGDESVLMPVANY